MQVHYEDPDPGSNEFVKQGATHALSPKDGNSISRRVRVTPFGRSAIHALYAAVADAQAVDPLAPITVVTPSGSGGCAGLHARRCLTLDPERGGLANVRFMSLSRLAELQGEVDLARQGKLPLNEALRLEFMRRALLSTTAANPLRAHAENPATFQTLSDAFAELDELLPDEQASYRNGSSMVASATVQIFDSYKAEIAKSAFYDEPDAMQAAAQAIRAGRADGAIGEVILYLPNGVLKCEIDLLRALSESGRLRVVVGLVGEATSDAETMTPLEALGLANDIRESIVPAMNSESGVTVVIDAEEEVRAAIADVRRRLIEDGTPLWRMALLYRVGDPYAAICAERLRAAGLPFFARSPRTLAQSIPGRILSGFLHARRENFSADSVREWLRSAPTYSFDAGDGTVAPSRRRLPVDVVEKIVRRYGALRGIESWVKTIDRMIVAREQALTTPADSSLAPDDYQIRGLRHISVFLQQAAYDDAQNPGTWAGYSEWCNEALLRLVGETTKDRHFSEEDEDALVSIGELIRSLGTLDAVRDGSPGSAVTMEAFVSAVDQILATAVKDPEARYGRGVFVGSLDDAYGLDFAHVFLLGTHDGALPPPMRSNPLLPSVVGPASTAREVSGAARERRAYLAATRCAPAVTYLYARADRRAGRPQMPSRCLLREMADMNDGQPVSSEMISGPKQITVPWITRWRSFDHAVRERVPGCEQDWNLRQIYAQVHDGKFETSHLDVSPIPESFGVDAPVHRAIEALQARGKPEITAWDGSVGAGVHELGSGPFSATRFETFAACPFRYYLVNVLKLEAEEEKRDNFQATRLERGNLLHDIVNRFFEERIAKGTMPQPDEPWSSEDADRLATVALDQLAKFEEQGTVLRTPLWAREKSEITKDLTTLLSKDSIQRNDDKSTPTRVELSFGDTEPVTLRLSNGQSISFHGRIDRLDIGEGGSAIVIDYKTGKADSYADITQATPVAAGRRLQLAIYALAAESGLGIDPPPTDVRARYWFVSERGDFKTNEIRFDSSAHEQLQTAMELMTSGMKAGTFPPIPGEPGYKGFANCGYCDYDRVCTADRGREWQAKKDDPSTGFLAVLAQLGGTAAETSFGIGEGGQ